MAKLRRKVRYEWFIESLDSHTNEVIMRECPAEETLRKVLCGDGASRDLVRCGYELIAKLIKSEFDLNIRFRIFNRLGRNGKIRDTTSVFKRKIKPKPNSSRKQ